MENMVIVRPGHLNHHGYLFGGQLLKWVDEFAWIAASRDYINHNLVTRGMDDIDFHERVISGSILKFCICFHKKGKTSISYNVKVYADEPGNNIEKHVFSTVVTFVNVDKKGNKKEISDISRAQIQAACSDG